MTPRCRCCLSPLSSLDGGTQLSLLQLSLLQLSFLQLSFLQVRAVERRAHDAASRRAACNGDDSLTPS